MLAAAVGVFIGLVGAAVGVVGIFIAQIPAIWAESAAVVAGSAGLGISDQLWQNYRNGGAPRDSQAVQVLDINRDEHPGVRDEEVDN